MLGVAWSCRVCRWLLGVVACLMLSGGLSSLRSWLCQWERRCVGCCVVNHEMLRLWRFPQKTITVIVNKLTRWGFISITVFTSAKTISVSEKFMQ